MATDSKPLEASKKEDEDRPMQVVLVGEATQENEDLRQALKTLGVKTRLSETGMDFIHMASEIETVFVLSEFGGDVFHNLYKAEANIVGPPVILLCAKENKEIPCHSRPLYCTAMEGVILCFTGLDKQEARPLAEIVHHMGGSVRRDVSSKVTHLIADCTDGPKYRLASSLEIPIVKTDWIYKVWADRDVIGMKADEKMVQHRVPPFYKCCLCFYGFSEEDKKHMEEVTAGNGGIFAEIGDEDCTHLVVDDQQTPELPKDIVLPHFIVRAEWFWGSIQIEACSDERFYEYQKETNAESVFTPGRSISGSKSRKRKRLKENIAQLAAEGELDSPLYKRRSSSEYSRISMSPSSFLDASHTPDKSDAIAETAENEEKSKVMPSKLSPRQQVVMELLQTEKNYVGILHTILNVFKSEIEKPNQYHGAILAPQDIKLIFGNIPPIYKVHCEIKEELTAMMENWTEECLVGQVISKHAEAMLKAYPPFVNYFEQTKETIAKCDKTNTRFHAFLKVCRSKPECGRQSLTELLIRPVQRLPSVSLLLGDIIKKTSKDNPDYERLENAIDLVKEIMTHINEDKRKTENQVVMFDIMNEIDNCPATLLSSHRSFVSKADVIELSDELCGRSLPLSLFLFTDTLEICKRRTKYGSTAKSPALRRSPQKPYKHLGLLQLKSVKRVINYRESEDCQNSFGIICRSHTDDKDKLYSFMIDETDFNKFHFLTSLARSIAQTRCLADHEGLIATVEGRDLQINTSVLGRSTFSRAAKLGKRVSRAFSFNKTPSRLKRAVSTVLSPFSHENNHNTINVMGTPRRGGDLFNRRQASCMDLTDSISLLSSYPSATTLYHEDDTVSLGAFSLQTPMEHSSVNDHNSKLMKPPS
ncbi:protein ECT2-like isoform X2 [Saccostrea echinata]|uniref:protein ECT2-like isoform X2 n=1 Tax=Saccostrea echinata TaxID=191078 RepID=UPI002A7EFB8C|nr:protein ECT2-like isoform X2 [Saccostrea echinata]